MTAIEVVVEIVRRRKLLPALTFGVYQTGAFKPLSDDIEKRAKRLRTQSRLHGYWPSVLTVCWANRDFGRALSKAILAAARHAEPLGVVRKFEMSRDEILQGSLQARSLLLRPGESLYVSSMTKSSDGRVLHLPMMDFTCHDTRQDLRKLVFALSRLGLRGGVVLRSSRSFHYYGLSTLSERQWIEFLGRCLLLVPISDARYIGHRMIDGYCTLRISSGGGTSKPPVVAAVCR